MILLILLALVAKLQNQIQVPVQGPLQGQYLRSAQQKILMKTLKQLQVINQVLW